VASLVFPSHPTRALCGWRRQVKAPAFAPMTIGAPTGVNGRTTPLDLPLFSHRMTRCTANAKLCGEERNSSGLGFRQDEWPSQSAWRCHACYCGLDDSASAATAEYLCWSLGYAAKSRISVVRAPLEAPATGTRNSARATEEGTNVHTCASLALPKHPACSVSISDSAVNMTEALEGRHTHWGSHQPSANGSG
jgi:hypothetical protein